MQFNNLTRVLTSNIGTLGLALQAITPVRTGALRNSISIHGEFNGTAITIVITINDYYKFLEHKYGYASQVNNLADLQTTGVASLDQSLSNFIQLLSNALSKDIEEAIVNYESV